MRPHERVFTLLTLRHVGAKHTTATDVVVEA